MTRTGICRRVLPGIFALAGSVLALQPAQAETVEEFYKGKNISAIIGFPPGGGYNTYMRLLGKHMQKYMPGGPSIVPRNMVGAGSLVAGNYIYNTAAKDGSVIGIFSSSTLFSKMLGEKKAQFEIAKFTWIGNLDETIGTCTVWHTSKIKSFSDFYGKQVIYASSGPGAVSTTHALGFNALLGTRVKVINGYAGSTGVLLAMQRGEADGGCGFAVSSLKAARRQAWKSGKLIVVIQTGRKKSADLPGIPHLYDMAKSEDDKKVMDLIYGTHALGRPISAPPGIPAERVAALRTAFNKTVKDKEFLAEAERRHLPINSWTGAETEKFIAQIAAYPQAIVEKTIKTLNSGEMVKVTLKKLNGVVTKVGKKKITVKDESGKEMVMKIHKRRTKLRIGGEKANISQIKADMSCAFEYFGAGDLAPKIACN